MSATDVMHRYLAAMQAGDRETAFGFYAEDLVAMCRAARRSRATCAAGRRSSAASAAWSPGSRSS
jgi:ketosteroid isomerase-like protein